MRVALLLVSFILSFSTKSVEAEPILQELRLASDLEDQKKIIQRELGLSGDLDIQLRSPRIHLVDRWSSEHGYLNSMHPQDETILNLVLGVWLKRDLLPTRHAQKAAEKLCRRILPPIVQDGEIVDDHRFMQIAKRAPWGKYFALRQIMGNDHTTVVYLKSRVSRALNRLTGGIDGWDRFLDAAIPLTTVTTLIAVPTTLLIAAGFAVGGSSAPLAAGAIIAIPLSCVAGLIAAAKLE